jgi:hypothetical protein
VDVSPHFWDNLQKKDLNTLCNLTLFSMTAPHQMVFHFLNEAVLVDFGARCLKRDEGRDGNAQRIHFWNWSPWFI